MSAISENYERKTIVWPDDYDIIKQELIDVFVNDVIEDDRVYEVIDKVAECNDVNLLALYAVFGALILEFVGESVREEILKTLYE